MGIKSVLEIWQSLELMPKLCDQWRWSSHWSWYDNIYPYIPQNEKQYYTEPFGGALQPSNYFLASVKSFWTRKILTRLCIINITFDFDGWTITIPSSARPAIHGRDFSATTHIIEGYTTVFLERNPPRTYGPGETYDMPGGGKTMTSRRRCISYWGKMDRFHGNRNQLWWWGHFWLD
jgi:hypothetical protein